MDLPSVISSIAAVLASIGEFLRSSALFILIYTALAALTSKLISKASDEFTTRGVQAAEFFRFAEKKR